MIESIRRDLAYVPRWSIMRTLRTQSVAEHSFFVCSYGMWLAEQLDWPACSNDADGVMNRGDLAVYLLRHDEAEALESDVPSPIKRLSGWNQDGLVGVVKDRFGPPPRYTRDMRCIRVVADLMDECFYLAGEIAMGNGTVRDCYHGCLRNLITALEALPVDSPACRVMVSNKVLDAIKRECSANKDMNGLQTPLCERS